MLTFASEGYVVDEISVARGQLLVVDIQVNAYINWEGGGEPSQIRWIVALDCPSQFDEAWQYLFYSAQRRS